MENYLLCIGKSSLAAGAFYLVFMGLFQNRKQFVFNRFYLPLTLALSFIIPLITFTTTEYLELPLQDSTGYSIGQATTHEAIFPRPQFTLKWHHYLFAIYITGIMAFLLHRLFGYYKAVSIIINSLPRVLFDTPVNIAEQDVHPFSFFNRIVLSEKTLSCPDLELIVAHEKIHVTEKHTLDILFTEILYIMQWFNPFARFIRDAVKNNLEYKVDDQIAITTDLKRYQLAIVAFANKKGIAPFLTALNGSQLKKRIIMMKQPKNNRYAMLKQTIVMPLIVVVTMGLSNREIKTVIISPDIQPDGLLTGNSLPEKESGSSDTTRNNFYDNALTDEKEITADNYRMTDEETNESVLTTDKQKYDIGSTESQLSPKSSGLLFENKVDQHEITSLTKNILNAGNTRQLNSTGMDSARNEKIIIKGKVISLHDRKPLQGATINFSAGNTKAGTVSNTKGDFIIQTNESNVFLEFHCEGYFSKEFAWDGSDELLVEMATNSISTGSNISADNLRWKELLRDAGIKKYPKGTEPVVIQDGYETLHNANDIPGLYDPSIIKSVRFKKNSNIEIKRKELAKNGFIEIKTSLPKATNKLYIIDGHEIFLKNQKPSVYIYPKQLQEMKELPKEEAVGKYGPKAKHGAIEITTKAHALNINNQGMHTFRISAEIQQFHLILRSLEGCEFKELRFPVDDNNAIAINRFGIVSTENSKASNNPGFIFEIKKVNDKINLTGIKGTTWKELSYTPASKMYYISETGVSIAAHPLIIVDGSITEYKNLDHIYPGDIQSVTVLNDKKATERYGEQGKNGVIEIVMKPR
jgi:hypothetical protein